VELLKLQNSCTFSNTVVSKTTKFVTFKHLLGFQNQSILLNHSNLPKLQKYFVSTQGQDGSKPVVTGTIGS
jgi:hypothetical protein